MKTLKPASATRCALAALLSLSTVGLIGCDSGKEAETAFDPAQITLPTTPEDAETQIQALKSRLFDDPNNELLLTTLGDVYFEAQRFLEAIPLYEKAAELNPVNADTFNDLGLCYNYSGQTDKALSTLDKAIQVDPLYKHAYLSKGFILFSKGRYDEAAAPLTKLKELDAGGPLSREADRFLLQIQQLSGQASGNN